MPHLVCVVDHTPFSAEAVEAAVARCRDRGKALTFVGVVEPFAEAAGPASAARVRRFGLVEENLVRAARTARAAGLTADVERRFGSLLSEAAAAADEAGADEIVLVEPRGLLRRRGDLTHIHRPRQIRRGHLRLVA